MFNCLCNFILVIKSIIMKKHIVYAMILITVCISACKKKNDPIPANNNEVNTTVVISPTSTITINAKGSKVKMGCNLWGVGTFINGTNDDNAAVIISYVYGSGSSCVKTPGTYNFSCEYRKNVADPNTPIWSNNGANRGSITFTAITDNYMEGYFNAVSRCNSGGCVFGVDSVIITGTFKGNF